jgi:rare lipoprotein A
MKPVVLLILIVSLWSCSKSPQSIKDSAPDRTEINFNELEPWTVQSESLSRYGNHSPYVVFGKTYHVVNTDDVFEQTGMASWYGKKFHGRKTSNMEVFDMYKMTAAHRTLPLPSYVEVTNLDNNKKVIVRVNDRGPFVGDRIIDLSWAAAKYLGYDQKGVTQVHIKLIKGPQQQPQVANNPEVKFLQVGAFSSQEKAMELAKSLSQLIMFPVHVTNTLTATPLFRVRLGPLTEQEKINDLMQRVHDVGFTNSKLVSE